MTSSQTPGARPSAAVYRRRRFAVLFALVAVIVIVVLLLVRPGSGSEIAAMTTSTPKATTTTPATTPPADATPPPISDAATADSGEAKACVADDIRVDAITNATSYAAGEQPQLSLSITNTGAAPCTMNAGTSQQVFTVLSGDEVYWTSTDCQTAPSDQDVLLEPGKTVSSNPPITWDRTRSAPDTCSATRDPVPAAGASYHLKTSIGGFASKDSAQFLLN
ncbi:hypothetical protein [Plantibacter sp. YIM 135249]|uniref:hypothetical protein n=1 Tax=Plantibacter sp. YIM 135249 TaxID=3423918 RepID=UPI003D34702A